MVEWCRRSYERWESSKYERSITALVSATGFVMACVAYWLFNRDTELGQMAPFITGFLLVAVVEAGRQQRRHRRAQRAAPGS